MFARIFKSNEKIAFVLLPILGLSVWYFSFYILKSNALSPEGGVLYPLLLQAIPSEIALKLINLVLMIFGAWLCSHTLIKQDVTEKSHHFAAFFFLTYNAMYNLESILHPLLVVNVLILGALYNFFNTYRTERALSSIFDAAFLFSLASLFYFPVILIFPICILALIVLRTFVLREWLLVILGICVPYLLTATFFFLFDISQTFWMARLTGSFSTFHVPISKNGSFIIHSLTLLFTVITFISYLVRGLGFKVKTQKIKTILLWLFTASFICTFFLHGSSVFAPILSVVPISLLFGDYVGSIKKNSTINFLVVLFLSLFIISNLQSVGLL